MNGGWRSAVADYAEAQPGFGGMFVDGSTVVVLFTDDIEEHRRGIRSLLPRRGRASVRQCRRTFAEMEQIQERVSRRLFGRDDLQVTEIGLDLDGDDVAVVVSLVPYTEAAAQRARALAAPDSIVVVPGEGSPVTA